MEYRFFSLFLFFIYFPLFCFGLRAHEWLENNIPEPRDAMSRLLDDLLIVEKCNQRLTDHLPITYNHLLQGGLFNMPSARMGEEGEMGIGYGAIPPYCLYSLRLQLVRSLEVSGNYRIFRGVDDPILTHHGFGDFSDKGANLKLALWHGEDTQFALPSLAIGLEDFMGTRAFKAYYCVATQQFLKWNLEFSIGYGCHRMRGWFGGAIWFPFRTTPLTFLSPLSIGVEYDAIPYQDELIEKHPKGRVKRSAWQWGMKYRAFDCVDISLAYIRGTQWAATISTYYQFGHTTGLLPKWGDRPPYTAPVNFHPLGSDRPAALFAQEWIYAFREQGLDISHIWLLDEEGQQVLRIHLRNHTYREEHVLRMRLHALLTSLLPSNIATIIICLETGEMPIQEWRYDALLLRRLSQEKLGTYELELLTPCLEVSRLPTYTSFLLFSRPADRWHLALIPKIRTLFGSARGKFKYALGCAANCNGNLPYNLFYSCTLGYLPLTDLQGVKDFDILNPSSLINVRSDGIRYARQRSVTLDEGYIEKLWNCGKGFYARLATGWFEPAYGGAAVEWLYYASQANWAIGMEGAVVKKRALHGIGFSKRIRKLYSVHRRRYIPFLGSQYFLNFYYDCRQIGLELRLSAGQFLARDLGISTELSRYFPSGLRIGFWYTYTNGKDIINGSIYHDKGVFFSIPLDLFCPYTSRERWGYGMSAWLRDVGASAITGHHLYDLIAQERQ